VLGWIGVELELNFTQIHPNTCGLRACLDVDWGGT
jgi:hypothetical protein